jgi:hypothetical protein
VPIARNICVVCSTRTILATVWSSPSSHETILPAWTHAKLARAFLIDIFLSSLPFAVHYLVVLFSFRVRSLTWSDISYRLRGSRIEVIRQANPL